MKLIVALSYAVAPGGGSPNGGISVVSQAQGGRDLSGDAVAGNASGQRDHE
jgi:hypothetical protein